MNSIHAPSNAASLVSESMDRKLRPGRRLGVRFHLIMCKHCARYKRQLNLTRRLITSESSFRTDHPGTTIDERAKKRLQQVIDENRRDKE
jgi:hypothetical protein